MAETVQDRASVGFGINTSVANLLVVIALTKFCIRFYFRLNSAPVSAFEFR